MSDSLEAEISYSQPITAQGSSKGVEPIENSQQAEQIRNRALNNNQQLSQGPDLSWNFDGMEDKNPFSEFSEEHLNKLDEVLSSAGVQELLQQSSPALNFLNLDGTEQLAGGSDPSGHSGQGDASTAATSRRDSSDSLPESIISVVFSDHGYCMNPDKVSAQKSKVVTTQSTTKSLPVMVAVEHAGSSIPINAVPTALAMATDSEAENTDSKMESPTTSPRKSGRAHTRNKYLDEDWVTQGSPSKGRGRGRAIDMGMPVPFGFRASTRISDQKQRDLAEKIMLANRQAMEAEMDTDDTEQSVESPVKMSPKGRGRGKGQSSPAGRVSGTSQSSQDESSQDETQDDEDDDNNEEENEDNDDDVSESDVSESEDEKNKSQKGGKKNTKGEKKKKKGRKYEDDSDFSAGEGKNTKTKTKTKKKGKNESGDEEVSDTKTKKGKKKKLAKGKKKAKPKGKKGKKKGTKTDKKSVETEENSETEVKKKSEEKSPKKKAKKLSKKERLKKMKEAKDAKKAKLLEKKKEKKKAKKKKGKETETETELSDVSPKKKAVKKGKGAVGKKKMDTEDESTDTSPKKKTKVNETKVARNKSPKAGEKRKASPARVAKNKPVSPVSTPTKKQKMTRQKKAAAKKSKAEITDSEDDEPVKATKVNTEKDATPSQEIPQTNIQAPIRGNQNIFASLAMGFMAGDDDVKDSAPKTADDVAETKKVSEETVVKNDKNKSESVEVVTVSEVKDNDEVKGSMDSVVKNINDKEGKTDVAIEAGTASLVVDKEQKDTVNSDNMKEKETLIKTEDEGKLETNVTEAAADTAVTVEQVTENNKLKDDKGQSGTHKRHDSEDSRGSSSHHHHHHKKHSHDRQDSVSEEKSDSGNHRHESRDRKDSSDRRHSQDRDRRSSRSHRDKDRHGSRKSSESSDRSRRESASGSKNSVKRSESVSNRRESVGSVSSDKSGRIVKKDGKLGKDNKVKGKKSKKSDDVPIDSSMADLFMPDNLPTPSKEEVNNKQTNEKEKKLEPAQEKERVSKVSFKDDSSSKKNKSEKDEVVGPEVIKLTNEASADKLSAENSKDVPKKEETKAVKIDETPDISVVNVAKDTKENTKACKSDNKEESMPDENLEVKKLDNSSETVEKSGVESDTSKPMEVDNETEVDIETVSETKDGKEVDTMLKEEVAKIENNENKAKTEEKIDIKETDDSLKSETKSLKTESVVGEETASSAKPIIEDTKDDKIEEKKDPVTETVGTPVKRKIKNPLKMSDFFSERRLKINDPKPRVKVVKEEMSTTEESDGTDDGAGRKRRNKSKALTEILKKEKLGSDDEEVSDTDFEDDENDEDFEDPDQLYCICRQPHNQRFMICCDKCEEWFHGKCVGITKARGAEMEKNNEDYVCPQCKQSEIQDKNVASTTQSPDQVAKKAAGTSITVDTDAGSSSTDVIKPDSTVDKDTALTTKDKSSTMKAPGEATPKSQKTTVKKFVILKNKQSGETTPKSEDSKEQEVISKQKSDKGQTTPKSDGKNKDKQAGSSKKKTDVDLSEKRKRMIQHVKEENSGKDKPKQLYNKCFTCNVRTPRKDSIYCSDDCRAKHSKHNVVPGILKNKDKKEKKKERHIAVVEPSTGRTLTGDKAPTERELKAWLQENPTFEVLKSHNKPVQRTPDQKSDSKDSSKSNKGDKSKKSEGPEPIRLNVRKGLRDALAARAEAADDVMLSSSEIKGVALSVEEELFKYFKDTDHKYKAKYRSLIFNIKDQKNKGLFRKILTGRVRASKLVRMTADELANRELAQWREHETKHTIEMIKQTEREHMKEPVHVMKKTHKGEQEVQDEEGEDLSTLASEPKKKEETVKHEQKEDDVTESLPDTTDTHGQHLFDANCKICTGKLVPAAETTPTKTKSVKTDSTPKKKGEEKKELTKQERDLQADEVVKEVLKAIQRAKADERKEELEAQQRSAVTVRSPDSALSSGLDKNVKFTPIGPMCWKGFIYMQDVSKFVTTAYRVTGSADYLSLPDSITLCGRISPEHVWDYLSKVKQSATRDICVVRFIPGVNEEKAAYINLYSYLNSRSRCGVVEHKAKDIKDFYIVPLASHSKIPSVLLPFDGPGLEENRCHMLLGVVIRNKVTRSKSSHSRLTHRSSKSQPLKSVLKDPRKTASMKSDSGTGFEPESPEKSSSSSPRTSSSSSTPQTIIADKKKAISFDPIVKEYSHISEQDDNYEPGSDYPLDLNAPYDPEKEAMKEPAKPKPEKSKSDPVTLMMEKIAQSKNPAEATAAMVAALATTSKLGNQRKLLLELTKKVDEQKRLLEQKRISTKLGQSPSGNSPGPSSTTAVTSTSATNIGISSKDPRLRAKTAAAAASEAASNINKIDNKEEQMDIDLRVPAPTGVPVPVGVPPPLGSSSIALTPSKPASVLPPSITTSALEKSMSILSSLTSDIASDAASPPIKSRSGASKETVVSSSVLSEDNNEVKSKLSQSGAKSDPIVKPKGFYVDQGEVEGMTTSNKVVSDSVTVKVKQTTAKTTDGSEETKNSAQHEIVSQLMAEVSGKSITDSKPVKKAEDLEIQEEIHDLKAEEKEQTDQSGKQVPNVAALFKGLANAGAGNSDASKKSGIQLPSALMSLFSKLPGSAEEPQEDPAKIPGFFTAESEEVVEDTDLRQSASSTKEESSVTEGNNKDEVKDTDGNLSKSFMGFDYDSDSSGGSFEGFDDDGTKKLSPRKRKYIQKSPHTQSPSTKTNLFGDVDERGTPPMEEDVDFREQVEDDVDLRQVTDKEQQDIDERMAIHMAGTSGQPLPPGEGPLHPFPPPGLGLPFISSSQPLPPGTESSQPLPPGVEWNQLAATSVPSGIPAMPHPKGEWGPPPLPEVSQPPLPAEPPKPKPPEPPMKKKKDDEGTRKDDDNSDNDGETKYQSKNSKKKKKKKERKNKKNGQQLSDERIQQIVLEIAKNEPIEPPPLPPISMHRMQYGHPRPPLLPLPPMGVPMASHGPPVTSQLMPHMDMPGIGNSTWMNTAASGPGLNAQSQIVPPLLPPHMQPGVVPNQQSPGPMSDPLGHNRYMDQPRTPKVQSRKDPSSKPPSLLDLSLAPPTKLLEKVSERRSNSRSGSPLMREARLPNEEQLLNEPEQNLQQSEVEQREQISESVNQAVANERIRDEEERSRERDREERRRRDGHRSRSRDRSRRSRSGERSYRSRSHEREADYHHGERSHDRDHHQHHYRDRRRGDYNRNRDRDYRSGRSHRH